jgi:ribonuclease I
MRHYHPRQQKFRPLLVMSVGLLAAWVSPLDAGNSPPRRAQRFDFYLLAMTWHPAYCADGNAREPECRTGVPVPISIHGLWPERLAHGKFPRDCAGPALDLERSLAIELAALMPGMADGLHEHEWRKHGRCSGLGDDEYFRHTLVLARRIDAALRVKLTTLAGGTAGAAELRAWADRQQPGLGATLTFHCRNLRDAPAEHRRAPHLMEIRQCLDDDGANGAPATPLACAKVNRRDQGCGPVFRIAASGRR